MNSFLYWFLLLFCSAWGVGVVHSVIYNFSLPYLLYFLLDFGIFLIFFDISGFKDPFRSLVILCFYYLDFGIFYIFADISGFHNFPFTYTLLSAQNTPLIPCRNNIQYQKCQTPFLMHVSTQTLNDLQKSFIGKMWK